MEEFVQILIRFYPWFAIAIALLIFGIIGYIADQGKKKKMQKPSEEDQNIKAVIEEEQENQIKVVETEKINPIDEEIVKEEPKSDENKVKVNDELIDELMKQIDNQEEIKESDYEPQIKEL